MEQRLILIDLLIKIGVAASAASILGRSVEFKSLLFRDERNWKQKIYLVLWIGIPLALGVWIRITVKSFLPGDLSFETTMLLVSSEAASQVCWVGCCSPFLRSCTANG